MTGVRTFWRANLPLWPRVITVTTTAARATMLREATEHVLSTRFGRMHDGAPAFSFASLDDVLGPAGPKGQIWQVAGRPGLHPLFPPAPVATL